MNNNRPARAMIDSAALKHNLGVVRQMVPDAKVMAVIKADGYGHGMEIVADALLAADEYAINSMDDVCRLRAHGVDKPLTALSASLDLTILREMHRLNVRPTIYHDSQIQLFEQLDSQYALSVWLKVDTGMGRLGFLADELDRVLKRLLAAPGVRQISIMTHLANADNPSDLVSERQLSDFKILAANDVFVQRSVLNSAGVINYANAVYDIVRPGIMLYGVSPQRDVSANSLGLRPVMTFKSQLISVKRLPTGSPIGYGGHYVLDQDSRVGVVACGYGDGYPRHAPTGTPVLINGVLLPLIGRVSMDMITVDLADTPAQVGDEAVLWGDGNPVEGVAEVAGTIAYELCCGILPRVERIVK